jgi:hypothetical protein
MLKRNNTLCQRLLAGDTSAREEMILANMDLVQQKVGRFLQEFPRYQYLADDLLSEGYLGLVQAVDRIAKGQLRNDRPTAFLSLYIHEAFATCINNEQLIQVPARTRRHLTKQDRPLPPVMSVPLSEAKLEHKAVDGSGTSELYDELLGCCECDVEREILELRGQGHKDPSIAAILDLSQYTVYMTRRELYERFLERNPEMKESAECED